MIHRLNTLRVSHTHMRDSSFPEGQLTHICATTLVAHQNWLNIIMQYWSNILKFRHYYCYNKIAPILDNTWLYVGKIWLHIAPILAKYRITIPIFKIFHIIIIIMIILCQYWLILGWILVKYYLHIAPILAIYYIII